MELAKATLQEISSDNPPRELHDPIPVQFNPTTLRLQLANQTEGGNSRGRQVRQYTGSSSTTLSLDLIFDTADEGTTEEPRSVREKTSLVENFVLPRGEGTNKQAPPKVRFHWGELIIDGLVDSVNIDFDHFAANGTPLRAKLGLSIKEQDSKYQFLAAGPGANAAGSPPAPGSPSTTAPGTSGSGGDKSALALLGESAADFAARVGVDPSAWRGLAAGLEGTLSLEAGAEIGFSGSLNASIGMGAAVGVQAGVGASLDVNLGLEVQASAASSTKAIATQNAGFNLSAAGGVGAAVESAKIASAQSAVEQTRSAFQQGSSGATTAVQLGLPEQSRVALAQKEATQTASTAPAPPRADTRASTYAFGVPLRSTVGAAALLRAGAMQGAIALQGNATVKSANSTSSGEPPLTFDPTTPKWLALPQITAQGSRRDSAGGRRPLSACGCAGRCGHR